MLRKWKSLKIGPFEFKVIYGYSDVKVRNKAPYNHTNGWLNLDELSLHINDDQIDEVAEEAGLHEALHAMIWVTGLSNYIGDMEKEEQIVFSLSPVLMHTLRSNYDFTRMVIGKDMVDKIRKKHK